MIDKAKILEIRKDFETTIDKGIVTDYKRDDFENDIKLYKNKSELHVSFGEKVVVMINHWEYDSKSLDIINENGKWMLEPNDFWTDYNEAIEVNEQFIEKILGEFEAIAANEPLESRT